MANYREDFANINLETGTISRNFMNHSIGGGDALGDRFGVRVFRNGEAVTLGGTCAGYFVRNTTGETVVISGGVVSGNEAYVTLPAACYAVEGSFTLAIKVTVDSEIVTLRIVDGVVDRTNTSVIVDPGDILPSIEDLLEAIETAVESIPADYSSLWTSLAPAFSSSTAYKAGQYVTYDGKLWRFTTDHAAGSWNAAHATQVNVGGDMSDLKSALSQATWNIWTGKLDYDSSSATNGVIYIVLPEAMPSGTYTLSCEITSSDIDKTTSLVAICDDTGWSSTHQYAYKQFSRSDRDYLTFTVNASWKRVMICASSASSLSAGDTVSVANIQLETGSVATPFIPTLTAFDRYAIHATDLYITSENIGTTYDDANKLPNNSIVGIAGTSGVSHLASSASCEYITIGHAHTGPALQWAIPFNNSNDSNIYIRRLANNVWSDWLAIQTNRNMLGYDLYPNGTTNDRASEIATILGSRNICRLAPGDYYISTVVLNEGKVLIGCGSATRLIRSSGATLSYMTRLQKNAKLLNVSLVGSTTAITPSNAWNIYDSSNPAICAVRIEGSGSTDYGFQSLIDGVKISGFAGSGVFVRKTGQAPSSGCLFNNLVVSNCNAGISFSDYAEFNRITGCMFQNCYYGSVNNGGNNVFTNCDFSDNVCGVLMDNSSDSFPNSSHGSFVGCTFNHIGEVPESGIRFGGNAIELNTMVAGEMFVGCNIFYGNLSITGSQGIVFDGCNFGSKTPINIVNGNVIMFNSCVYRRSGGINESPITYNIPVESSKLRFNGCYYLSGADANESTLRT